jgi:branched-chain amino acid transport system ATP-binding protein
MSLTCTGVRKRFGGFLALDGVSLAVQGGEILGVAGPNGAGKTTLFDIVSGHLKPDAGTVELGGREITKLPAHRRARLGLARTFQSPIVPTQLTVAETLQAARLAWAPRIEEGELERVCALVGFGRNGDRLSGLLDTLDRRRLLLCCLLIRRPSVLLLDEPCSGLLRDEIHELDRIVRSVRDETGMALVIVEHRLEVLTATAERLMVLDEGRVIAEGVPAEVLAEPAVKAAYFGAPRAAA